MRLVSLMLAMVLVVLACDVAAARDCCKPERVRCCEPKAKCCAPVTAVVAAPAAKCCEPKQKCCKQRIRVCETATHTKCDRCGNAHTVTRTRVHHERVCCNKPVDHKSSPTLVPVPAA